MFKGVAQMPANAGSLHCNPANLRPQLHHAAHETFITPIIALCGLRLCTAAATTQHRAGDDLDLPSHIVAAGRLQLPASSDLLGLRRRGHRTLRSMGRRLDDASAAVALPALGYRRDRQRSADSATGRTMVLAVALWALARRQCALTCERGFRCMAPRRETSCASSANGA